MLSDTSLKLWIHRDLNRISKTLLLLYCFDRPVSLLELRGKALSAGFRTALDWNLSDLLARSRGCAIRVPDGWEITDSGKKHLQDLGVEEDGQIISEVSVGLRNHLPKIFKNSTRAFAEEAIRCYELNLYRSAIVMAWIAAVDVLYAEVVSRHLTAFNLQATSVDPRWRVARSSDGLSRMKESDFLDRLVSIGLIGKSVKDELAKALSLRNGCGHPNSLRVGASMTASHLETLLLNVFQRFDV